ncbi:flagellin [Falsiroseomonas sp. CW058]|uniref:flagellin n=1 Tax=Falsiroseomonas sp. CW058 TaxID=3388664 RepID=UPI003D31FD40
MSIIGTIGALAIDQAALRNRMDVVSRQVATGQKGERHGDLGAEARRAIGLRGEIARREAQAAAADRALARADVTQGVLGRLDRLAGGMAAEALRARTLGTAGVEALAIGARAALAEAATLLNTRHDGEYLFAGSDVAHAPVPDGAAIGAGAMAGAVSAAVLTLGPGNAAGVLAATAAAAGGATSPFSAFLEGPGLAEPRRAVQVAEGERVALGVFANRDQADEATLSWGRELLRGLATLAALTPAQAAQGDGYQALLDGVRQGLAGAAAGLAEEQGALGTAEARIGATRDRHRDTLVALRAQLGGAEEVDLAAASAAMRQLQSRLEASYEATSMVARLSLAALLR